MKNADLRQVTLFEELVLLKEYEKREDVLAEKVSNKQQEKLDQQAKVRFAWDGSYFCSYFLENLFQGSHRLEKYLNIQECLEKFLKI